MIFKYFLIRIYIGFFTIKIKNKLAIKYEYTTEWYCGYEYDCG